MKKALVSTDLNEKIQFILNVKPTIVLLPKRFKNDIESHDFELFFLEDMSSAVKFLNLQSKLNANSTVLFYNVLRYKNHDSTINNKLYKISKLCGNSYLTDNFPFYFDSRNLFVLLSLIGEAKYHSKQFYDNSFYTENGLQANSFRALKDVILNNIDCKTNAVNAKFIEWAHTNEEQEYYEKYKKNLIYERMYSKKKIITCLQGKSNRFLSKIKKLNEILDKEKKCVIYTNWDKGCEYLSDKVCYIHSITTYHQKSKNPGSVYVFFETIISQRIRFYDCLADSINEEVIFFVNGLLGADNESAKDTIGVINDLNEFYSLYKTNE